MLYVIGILLPYDRVITTKTLAVLRLCFWVSLTVSVPVNSLATRTIAHGNQARSFTVADDIELTQFHGTDPDQPYDYPNVSYSPDKKLFLVLTDRGRLDINRIEASIRLYRVTDVFCFLQGSRRSRNIAPIWILTKATYKYGPVISDLRWLPDSSGFAFLLRNANGNKQLFITNILNRTVESFSPGNREVTGFDVRSRRKFVYTVLSPEIQSRVLKQEESAIIDGTGRPLDELMSPDPKLRNEYFDLSEIWIGVDERRFRLRDESKHTVFLHHQGQRALAISPDGKWIATALTVADVPAEWESLYPPATGFQGPRLGLQQLDRLRGWNDQSEYAVINIRSGQVKFLTNAPTGFALGWAGITHAEWSPDGHSLLFTNTFLRPKAHVRAPEARPCVAIADVLGETVRCLDNPKPIPSGASRTSSRVISAHFLNGRNDAVMVQYSRHTNLPWSTTFVKRSDDWATEGSTEEFSELNSPEVMIQEAVNERPLLVALDRNNRRSRLLWDPNPQLSHIALGEASVFHWSDTQGRDWLGGLYKPPDFVPGHKYPLVIQANAFNKNQFLPSGSYPTIFAAQELAAAGIVVLQSENCPLRGTRDEGGCQVAGYESAIARLTEGGIVDPKRIGISGFSRSCYYVAETLTTSKVKFTAALIADGTTIGYPSYLRSLDSDGNLGAHDMETLIGSTPFGAGLEQWFRHSPLFNLDRVTTPVEVLARRSNLLTMWDPYAALRYSHKPVDLVVINSPEHVFTNPQDRLIAQGLAVDWFRFWLQGYEDRDQKKQEQYKNWRSLLILRSVKER